eukprot:1666162-Amphidinium_carterae.1
MSLLGIASTEGARISSQYCCSMHEAEIGVRARSNGERLCWGTPGRLSEPRNYSQLNNADTAWQIIYKFKKMRCSEKGRGDGWADGDVGREIVIEKPVVD